MKTVVAIELSDAQRELPRLVEVVRTGVDILITVNGEPKARLTRVEDDETIPETGPNPAQ